MLTVVFFLSTHHIKKYLKQNLWISVRFMPRTNILYGETLWKVGQGLIRDSVEVGAVINRLPQHLNSLNNFNADLILSNLYNERVNMFHVNAILCSCHCSDGYNFASFSGTKKKLHGLSPRANYTDRATAAFVQWNLELNPRWNHVRLKDAMELVFFRVCFSNHFSAIALFSSITSPSREIALTKQHNITTLGSQSRAYGPSRGRVHNEKVTLCVVSSSVN
jgi:hypothetical protein